MPQPVNRLYLMTIELIKTEVLHCFEDISVEARLGAIDRLLRRKIVVMYNHVSEFPMGF
jgi:hypothetical protein